jgi:hypothetical protein
MLGSVFAGDRGAVTTGLNDVSNYVPQMASGRYYFVINLMRRCRR